MSLTKVSYSIINGAPVSVLDYGAVGDGIADDTAAVNAALAASSEVFFPAGAYLVTTLTVNSGNRLFGDSYSAVIKSSTSDAITLISKTNIVFENLTFDGINASATSFFAISNNCERVTIRENRFINNSTAIYGSCSIANRARNIVIENNEFFDNKTGIDWYVGENLLVVGNTIKYGPSRPMERGFSFHGVRNSTVGNNLIFGDNVNTITGIIFLYSSSTDAYFGSCFNNIVGNQVYGITEEAISFDQSNGIYKYGGTATSGGNTSLTDSSATWTTNQWANYYVVIVAGTGAGQYRLISSNTGTVLTVPKRWGVNPDATSVYSITPAMVGNAIVGNTVSECRRHGIVLYGPCLTNTISGNTVSNVGTDTASTDPLHAIHVWGVHRGSTGAPANDRQPCFQNVITGNAIHNTSQIDAPSGERPGIYLKVHGAGGTPDWQLYGNVVTNNTIGDRVDQGIYLERVTQTIVTGNTINARRGIKFAGLNETDNQIIGNTAPNAASMYIIGATPNAATTFGYRTVATAPSLTPFYIGEDVLDTVANKWYRAKGLTSADWVALN